MKTVRIGIFGLQRGASYIDNILANNGEIVAICDKDKRWRDAAAEKLGEALKKHLDVLGKLSGEELAEQRYAKFRAIGRYVESTGEKEEESGSAE